MRKCYKDGKMDMIVVILCFFGKEGLIWNNGGKFVEFVNKFFKVVKLILW